MIKIIITIFTNPQIPHKPFLKKEKKEKKKKKKKVSWDSP